MNSGRNAAYGSGRSVAGRSTPIPIPLLLFRARLPTGDAPEQDIPTLEDCSSRDADDGTSWTPAMDTAFPNPGAGIEAVRLASGNWALISDCSGFAASSTTPIARP